MFSYHRTASVVAGTVVLNTKKTSQLCAWCTLYLWLKEYISILMHGTLSINKHRCILHCAPHVRLVHSTQPLFLLPELLPGPRLVSSLFSYCDEVVVVAIELVSVKLRSSACSKMKQS